MPEDKKTVDIDTTGPGAEVELPEEKDKAVITETAPEPEKEKDEKKQKKVSDERRNFPSIFSIDFFLGWIKNPSRVHF